MSDTLPTHASLLARVEIASRSLSPSEASVAAAILAAPSETVGMSIAALAQRVGVSEPSVARFCKSLGFSGFREFKIALAYAIARGVPFVHGDVAGEDGVGDVLSKVVSRAIASLAVLRDNTDAKALERAIAAIAGARRLEFYGQGNSGIVAQDAQHKFFRLGIPTAAYSDPHVHSMAAALLGKGDVVLVFSAGGRTLDILHSAAIAQNAGATVIALTVGGSPLAKQCDIVVATDLFEDQDLYSPMTSRLSHLALIDVLAVGVAIRLGPGIARTLEKAKAAVLEKRTGSARQGVRGGKLDD
ncbi:MAG TPA: SIS domain-containing protein [Rhabdaerophilum sp.]|nr:SIS domain-containing protein [Rhabdaerophilum sp.]